MKRNKLALFGFILFMAFSINLNFSFFNANNPHIKTIQARSFKNENNLQGSSFFLGAKDGNYSVTIEKIRKFDNNTNGTPFFMLAPAQESGISFSIIIIVGVIVVSLIVISVVIVRKRRIIIDFKEATKFQVDSYDELEEIITKPFKVIPREIFIRVQNLEKLSEQEKNSLLGDLATIDEKYWEEWLQMVENFEN